MESLLDYIEMLEDLLENSQLNRFTKRASIDKDRALSIISDMRLSLPTEFRQAQRLLDDYDKIINEAKATAASLIKDAEAEARSLVSDHNIFRQANEHASEMLEAARRDTRDMRLNAMEYADELLEKTESIIREAMENIEQQSKIVNDYFSQTIDALYENRQLLRGDR